MARKGPLRFRAVPCPTARYARGPCNVATDGFYLIGTEGRGDFLLTGELVAGGPLSAGHAKWGNDVKQQRQRMLVFWSWLISLLEQRVFLCFVGVRGGSGDTWQHSYHDHSGQVSGEAWAEVHADHPFC